MLPRIILPALSVVSLFVTPVLAVPITFDLRDTTATSEIENGVIVRAGITASLTALVANWTGSLNQTSGGFGVDATDAGDVTSRLDAGLGAESIAITFDVPVNFLGLGLSDYSIGESASLKIADFTAVNLVPQASASDVYTFATDNLVLAGQTVALSHLSGNGFSFDNFTVELAEIATPPNDAPPTSVPDGGSTAAMLAVPVCALFATKLRRRSGC